MKFLMKRLRWVAVGAALAWFLDPEHGPARRQKVQERLQQWFPSLATSRAATSGDSMWTAPVPNGPPSTEPIVAPGAMR
jgi:hypothetical protein